MLPYLLSLPVPAAPLLSLLAADPVLRLAALLLFTARRQPSGRLQELRTLPGGTQCKAYKVSLTEEVVKSFCGELCRCVTYATARSGALETHSSYETDLFSWILD